MGKHPYKYGKTPPGDPWDPPMGSLGPPHGSPGTPHGSPGTPHGIPGWASGDPWGHGPGPLGTHGPGDPLAKDPGLWGPGALGTRGLWGPGAHGDPGTKNVPPSRRTHSQFYQKICVFFINYVCVFIENQQKKTPPTARPTSGRTPHGRSVGRSAAFFSLFSDENATYFIKNTHIF